MTNRPVGIYLICLSFGIAGVSSFHGGVSLIGDSPDITGEPILVHIFFAVTPYYYILLGFLVVAAAVLLWWGSPIGRTVGFVGIGLWLLGEFLLTVWTFTGPDLVQQAGPGPAQFMIRLLVGVFVGYYLWTTGHTYVNDGLSSSAETSG